MALRRNFTGAEARTCGDDWPFFLTRNSGGLQTFGLVVSMEIRRHRDTATLASVNSAAGGGIVIALDTDAAALIPYTVTALLPQDVRLWYQVKLWTPTTEVSETLVAGFIQTRRWVGAGLV